MRPIALNAILFGLICATSSPPLLASDDWSWLSPPKAADELLGSRRAADDPLGFTKANQFEVGELRQRDGGQAPVVDAVRARVDTPLAFFQLAAATNVFNESTARIIIERSDTLIRQIGQGQFTLTQLVDALNFSAGSVHLSNVTFDSIFFGGAVGITAFFVSPSVAVGSLRFADLHGISAVNFSSDEALGRFTVSDPAGLTATDAAIVTNDGTDQVHHFQSGAPVFYALNAAVDGDFDIRADGFVVDPEAGNEATTNASASLLASFSHASTLTGGCAGCSFNENDDVAFEAIEIGANTTHGVAWATVLPPFDFDDPDVPDLQANAVLAYITADELTPRDQLPNTGIATFDTIVGGSAPFAAERGVGSLDAFSATVDFAASQVTALSLSGQFGPGAEFSAANSAGAVAVQANGTFATPLAGNCSFCGAAGDPVALNGQFGGGFTSGGAALLGAYGLRPATLTGSTASIVGSVLATE